MGSLALFAAGCNKPADKADADKTAPAAEAGKPADGKAIAGLADREGAVSYMIGMGMGKSLEPIKDEIDLDVVVKAVKSSLAGEKLLIDEKQAAGRSARPSASRCRPSRSPR